MASDWEKLAEEYKDHKTALVAEIDCTKDEGGMLCETLGVEGFPTLLYGDIDDPEVSFVVEERTVISERQDS